MVAEEAMEVMEEVEAMEKIIATVAWKENTVHVTSANVKLVLVFLAVEAMEVEDMEEVDMGVVAMEVEDTAVVAMEEEVMEVVVMVVEAMDMVNELTSFTTIPFYIYLFISQIIK